MDIEPPDVTTRLWQKLRAFLNGRFFRFLIVGGVNTVFGYGVFAIVYFASHNYRAAIVVATLIGIAFNFFTTGRVVFGNRSARAALPFVLGYGVTLAVNLTLAELFVAAGAIPPVAQALALPFVVLASYFINARLVFRGKSSL